MTDKNFNPDDDLERIVRRYGELEMIEHMMAKEKMRRMGLWPEDKQPIEMGAGEPVTPGLDGNKLTRANELLNLMVIDIVNTLKEQWKAEHIDICYKSIDEDLCRCHICLLDRLTWLLM